MRKDHFFCFCGRALRRCRRAAAICVFWLALVPFSTIFHAVFSGTTIAESQREAAAQPQATHTSCTHHAHTGRGAARARCCAAPRRGKRSVAHIESQLHEERGEEAARAAVAAAQRRLHVAAHERTAAARRPARGGGSAAALLCSAYVGTSGSIGTSSTSSSLCHMQRTKATATFAFCRTAQCTPCTWSVST